MASVDDNRKVILQSCDYETFVVPRKAADLAVIVSVCLECDDVNMLK